jgi:hypothetical protein
LPSNAGEFLRQGPYPCPKGRGHLGIRLPPSPLARTSGNGPGPSDPTCQLTAGARESKAQGAKGAECEPSGKSKPHKAELIQVEELAQALLGVSKLLPSKPLRNRLPLAGDSFRLAARVPSVLQRLEPAGESSASKIRPALFSKPNHRNVATFPDGHKPFVPVQCKDGHGLVCSLRENGLPPDVSKEWPLPDRDLTGPAGGYVVKTLDAKGIYRHRECMPEAIPCRYNNFSRHQKQC